MFEKKVIEEKKQQGKREIKNISKQGKTAKKKGGKGLSIVKTLVIPAIVAAIVVCVLYVAIERNVTQEELKTTVVCIKEDVKANTYVEKEEIDKYFMTTSVELAAVPVTAIKSISDLSTDGFYIDSEMSKSQMVLSDNLVDTDEVMDKYLSGYEVTSFGVDAFDNGVNGSIRKGDIVNIFALDPTTEVLVLMVENVYVSEVYDNAGNQVIEDNEIATSFTVYTTEAEVEQMNMAVVYGGIQMYLETK